MKTVLRALVGLSGLLSILMVLGLWFGMERILPAIGLMTNDLAGGLVGRATVRADIAGLFGGMGIAMLIAAYRESRAWAGAALLFVSVALAGRLIGLALDGAPAEVIPPIVIEAFTVALLASYRARLS
jgi:hypothetical protein